ncbi:ABC transporter ATP-binding protein [uncultured Winogradskyella sp.]|uniref:ATP-binding cassette domain-containing protein n=1 Tax=uncultured Winogradskyella sp. TaxID=395353 RepID=UPI00262B8E2F|nr:ABC transporter ATP-binding protein [uncultured Winogradskyella sp.]
MISLLKKIISIIPDTYQKKLPFFLGWSFLNTLLEFISIGALVPFILALLNKEKANEFFQEYFSIILNESTLIYAVGFLFLFYILKNVIQTLIIKKQSSFIYRIAVSISKQLVKDYLNDTQKHFTVNKGAFLRDLQQIPTVFATQLLTSLYILSTELCILLGIIVVSLFINFKLALIASISLITITVMFLFVKKKKVKKLNDDVASGYQLNTNHLINVLNGFTAIKSALAEEVFTHHFHQTNKHYNEQLAKLRVHKLTSIRFFEFFIIIGIALLLLFMQLKGSTNILLLAFFTSALIKLIPSFNKISNAIIDLRANRYAVDILDKKLKISADKKLSYQSFKKTIELKEVSFSYQNSSTLFSNIDITINKGSFTLITGASGEGKTTLLRILSGMVLPSSGNLKIDGYKQETPSFYPFIAYLEQQPYLFHGTLLENITMFKIKDIDKEYIEYLLTEMELTTWYNSLSCGLETVIHADSKSISGGQKQRIALVRALYIKSPVLLLDEATNQLNKELTNVVMQFLAKEVETKGLTIVLASHNESLKQYATQHLHLDKKNKLHNV